MIPPFPLDQALALSTEAGWNQNEADWQRIMELAKDGCFGAWADGRLVSSTVSLVYEPKLAWIGMVLTTETERGKGHARRLLLEALDSCDRLGVRSVKLDATDLGRPVYAKLGFVDERPVSRWLRMGGAKPVSPLVAGGEPDYGMDLEAFGADRSALLRALSRNEVYVLPGRGFAMARPGRRAWQFGPCVAQDEAAAGELLAGFLAAHGDEPSLFDICDEHEGAVRLVREAGYEPIRHLMRMYRGDAALARVASGPSIYALAAFEYG